MWLATVAPVLRSLVTQVALETAVPNWDARWRDEQRPAMQFDLQAEVLLQVTSIRNTTNGHITAEVAGAFTKTIEGMRDLVLQIQARSYSQQVPQWALEYTERIAARLRRDSSREALAAVNVALVDIGETTPVDNVRLDDRLANVAILDVFLRAGFTDTAGAEIIGYFDKIELSSMVAGVDGVIYPSGVNATNIIVPPGV